MSALAIVGGVYRERCSWPEWDQVYGSGGRAAAAVAGLVEEVSLKSYASGTAAQHFSAYADMYGFSFEPTDAPQLVSFEYVHPMSVPVIRPTPGRIARLAPISVSAGTVLRFGMMEGSAIVRADTCVYDPQSAFSPEPFGANGSAAKRLALVANRGEVMGMAGGNDPLQAARSILLTEGAEIVVVKCGAQGAMVVTRDTVETVPAFRSDGAFTIGSGDVFAATFAACWGVLGIDPVEATRSASMAVAEYVASRSLPVRARADLAKAGLQPLVANPGNVYLAGPFFTMAQRWLVEEARRCLGDVGMTVFSPFHEIGSGLAGEVAPKDIEALERCDVVFAILDGLDSGTLFEVGYARALGKPVYGFAQTVSDEDLKMVVGSGCLVFRDFTTAVHQLAWRP